MHLHHQHNGKRNKPCKLSSNAEYLCPMHPEVVSDKPGQCPKCGMALEPKTVSAGVEGDDIELRDMTRRFWIGGALTLPILLLAMAHLIPSLSHADWVSGEADASLK